MKTLLRKVGNEWEKALLWACIALLTLVAMIQLSGLLGEQETGPLTAQSAQTRRSLLNDETAFSFLQPLVRSGDASRNPFAFSCRFPARAQGEAPTRARPPWKALPKPPEDTAMPAAAPAVTAAKPEPAAPPKRAVVILYRGLYRGRGGEDTPRQLAFITARETPANVSNTVVAGEGETAAGVTIRSFTADKLVVAGPIGDDVTIPRGQQKKIPLE